jgi:hypothetical protein
LFLSRSNTFIRYTTNKFIGTRMVFARQYVGRPKERSESAKAMEETAQIIYANIPWSPGTKNRLGTSSQA